MSNARGQHSAHGHGHGLRGDADRRFLIGALLLILAFMAVEVVVGVLAHSLALLSDAGHMLTDAGAIGLALVAMRIAARPPAGGFTYGLKRAEIISAQINGITLLLLAAWFVVEATELGEAVHPGSSRRNPSQARHSKHAGAQRSDPAAPRRGPDRQSKHLRFFSRTASPATPQQRRDPTKKTQRDAKTAAALRRHSGTLAHRSVRSLGGVRERRRGLAADNRRGLVNQFVVV